MSRNKIISVSKTFCEESLSTFFGIRNPINVIALNRVSLSFDSNEILGIWGNNGSGKSTLMRIIGNILIPDEGEIQIDPNFKRIYLSGNERSFFWRLSVLENLKFFGAMYGINKNLDKKIYEISEELEILDILDRQFMTLSSGNKKRLSVAKAFLKDPEIILFDEITSSIDWEYKINLIEKVKKLAKKREKIVFWSSHDANEIINIADRVLTLQNGQSISCVKNHNLTFNGKKFYENE